MPNCPICSKLISRNCRAVECDLCLKWIHYKCSPLSLKQFNSLSVTNDFWLCQLCSRNVFPSFELNHFELLELSFNSNTKCQCSTNIDHARLLALPSLEITSTISNLPNVNDIDPDLDIPSQINSKYYTPHGFHSSFELPNLSDKSLSFLHCNIRSISKNFDSFQQMLSTLDHPFKMIGLSETWNSIDKDTPISNVFLPGFKFISQPTKFSVGGVSLLIADRLLTKYKKQLKVANLPVASSWI
jgi:hypothetical protein